MLSKQIVVDQITIDENATVSYRIATRIDEDGTVLSQSFHRAVLLPGDNTTDVPLRVASICNLLWTPEVVQTFADSHSSKEMICP